MIKNNKGVTLIALVITIIVLLILAGVSIAMLTGNNGILTRASSSKTETLKAEALERVNMELNAQLANVMAGDAFDPVANINAVLADMPTGYSASAVLTAGTAGTYATTDVLTITLTAPSGVTLTTSAGTVAYDTDHWKVTPVK